MKELIANTISKWLDEENCCEGLQSHDADSAPIAELVNLITGIVAAEKDNFIFSVEAACLRYGFEHDGPDGQEPMKALGLIFKAQVRIVCAANQDKYGHVFLGVRHHDSIMNEAIAYSGFEDQAWKQGFITNVGVFLSRQAAWHVAEAAGQIIRRCGGDTADGGTLYSENLY